MQIFVSHAHADREFAMKMAELLEATGHSTWLPEKDLLPGDNWAQADQEARGTASQVILQ